MPARRRTAAVAAAIVTVLLLGACTDASGPTPVDDDVAVPGGDGATELQVVLGDDVPSGDYVVTGARQRVQLGKDGDAQLAFEVDTPALLSAIDERTGTTLSAIGMPISELEPVPLTIDWTSTAFTSWVTSAGWVTSDTGPLLVLRKLAAGSPHLDALADALADGDTMAAEIARTGLSEDVAAAMAVPGAPETTATAAGRDAVTVTTVAHRPAAAVHAPVADGPSGDEHCLDQAANALGWCVTASADDPFKRLEVSSTAPTWIAAFAVEGSDVVGPPIALIPPVTYGGITLTGTIKSLGKSAWGALGNGLCGIVSFFGSQCSEKTRNDNDERLGALAEQSWKEAGEGTVLVPRPTGPVPATAVITSGANADGLNLTGPNTLDARSLVYMLDTWSYLVAPTIELAVGSKDLTKPKKAEDTRDGDKVDGRSTPAPGGAVGTPASELTTVEKAEIKLIEDLWSAASGFDAVVDAFEVLDDTDSDLEVVQNVFELMTTVGESLINNRGLVGAVMTYVYDSITSDVADKMFDVIISSGLKTAGKAVPVVGWITAAGDFAAQAAGTAQQVVEFVIGMNTLPLGVEIAPLWWDVLASDPERLATYRDEVLRGWDYASTAIPNPGGAVGPFVGGAETRDLGELTLSGGTASGIGLPETGGQVTVTLFRPLWPAGAASAGWLIVKADWGSDGPDVCRYPVSMRWLTPKVGPAWCEQMETTQGARYMQQFQWAVSADGALLERVAPDDWTLDQRDVGWAPDPEVDWQEVAFGYAERSFSVRDGIPVVSELPQSDGATWRAPHALRVRSADLGEVSVSPPPCVDDDERVCDI